MSIDELKRFSAELEKNEEMVNELKKLGSDEDAIVKFAQDKGFNFSKADLEASKNETAELSDKDLEKAAGGQFIGGQHYVIAT